MSIRFGSLMMYPFNKFISVLACDEAPMRGQVHCLF